MSDTDDQQHDQDDDHEPSLAGDLTDDEAARARGKRLGVGNRAMPPATLARVVALRAEGLSLAAVAAQLTAEGIPPARGGATWHPSAVRAALRSHALDQEAARLQAVGG